jgi:alcohol dehydrogenase, propanol-preferring
MRAIVFDGPGRPLRAETKTVPAPGAGQLLLKVSACGVCRTDLHLLDGEVAIAEPPRILGHQIVGVVEAVGPARGGAGASSAAGAEAVGPAPSCHRASSAAGAEVGPAPSGPRASTAAGGPAGSAAPALIGRRVGVPWLGWTCGECEWCRCGRENLCPRARFTGRDIDGGMAEYTVADERYCFPLPDRYPDEQAAPLLCAGLIGWRSLRMCGEARRLGLYGFGAAAHIVAQIAIWQGRQVFALTRPADLAAQAFARRLGAVWTGGSDQKPPEQLDAAIVFAPDGALIPQALRALRPGGTVVCGGIHMSDIPAFPYEILWGERSVRSVANLTRRDASELLGLAPTAGVRTEVSRYPLEDAAQALDDLRAGRFSGAAVLVI